MLSNDPLTWFQDSPQLQALLIAELKLIACTDWAEEPDYGDAIAIAREVLPEFSFLPDLLLYALVDEACTRCWDDDWTCNPQDRPAIATFALAFVAVPHGMPEHVGLLYDNVSKVGQDVAKQLALTGSVDGALQATRSRLAKLMR